MRPKAALISVWDKEGIIPFTQKLQSLGWHIFASSGTSRHIAEAGLAVTDVAELERMAMRRLVQQVLDGLNVSVDPARVGQLISAASVGEPAMGGRVRTLLSPVYKAILARNILEDDEALKSLGLPRIGLVCVDFYPLELAIRKEGSTRASVIEATDIGGPTLIRAAAKSGFESTDAHPGCITICDPADRQKVIDWLQAGGPKASEFIRQLSVKAEFTVARYAAMSGSYQAGESGIDAKDFFKALSPGQFLMAMASASSRRIFRQEDPADRR